MYEMVKERIKLLREKGALAVVVDAAILVEAGWDSLVDEVWVVAAPEDVVVQRIGQRDGLSAEQIRQRIRSQLSSEERERHASLVIDNGVGLKQLKTLVRDAWEDRVIDGGSYHG